MTLDGMEMLVSPVQPLNAEPTICLIPSGILYSPEKFLGMYANIEELKTGAVSPVQPEKASSPMEVTLDGMVMLVRPVQPLNAEPTIRLIPSGMLYSPEKFRGRYANIEELKTGAVSPVQP